MFRKADIPIHTQVSNMDTPAPSARRTRYKTCTLDWKQGHDRIGTCEASWMVLDGDKDDGE